MTKREINMLETAKHIANRGSKALLAIEHLGYKAQTILKSDYTPAEEKVKLLTEINNQILQRVMEGTSDLYVLKKNT